MGLFLLAACLALTLSGCEGKSKAKDKQEAAEKPVPVQVVALARETVAPTIEASGVVASDRDVIVLSETSGRVVEDKLDLGSRVGKGETLVAADPEPYQIQVRQAEASLAQAKSAFEQAKSSHIRAEALHRSDNLSESQYDDARFAFDHARAAMQVAEAALATARRALRTSAVRAPFSGVVAQKLVRLGDTLGPGTPVAALVDDTALKVVCGVGEDDVAGVKSGMKAVVRVQTLSSEPLPATVTATGLKALKPTMTYPVELTLDSRPEGLRVGMVARVELPVGEAQTGIIVPLEVIVVRFDRRYAYVVENGVAREKRVSLGMKVGNRVFVAEGLSEGESLVVSGQANLKDGAAVTVVE